MNQNFVTNMIFACTHLLVLRTCSFTLTYTIKANNLPVEITQNFASQILFCFIKICWVKFCGDMAQNLTQHILDLEVQS